MYNKTIMRLPSRLHKPQYKISEAAYVAINAMLPIAAFLLINSFSSFYPALALVLLSKWRIIALRPRFWWMSIKSNAVDILFGVSIVSLLYMLHGSSMLLPEIIVALGYEAWLLYLKPRSDNLSVLAQAGISQFLALTVLFSLSTVLNDFIIIIGCWVIGYSAARHALGLYSEDLIDLLSSFWGLLTAQIGWLLFHWTISYDIGISVKIPQMALIMAVLSFATTRLYVAGKSNRLGDTAVRVSTIFSAVLLLVILVFSRWDVTI